MNNAILFDRERAEAKAAAYGATLRKLNGEAEEMYEIRLGFDESIPGRSDVTFIHGDGRAWTVDPYFEENCSFTPDQARSVAKSLQSAADLADELNAAL